MVLRWERNIWENELHLSGLLVSAHDDEVLIWPATPRLRSEFRVSLKRGHARKLFVLQVRAASSASMEDVERASRYAVRTVDAGRLAHLEPTVANAVSMLGGELHSWSGIPSVSMAADDSLGELWAEERRCGLERLRFAVSTRTYDVVPLQDDAYFGLSLGQTDQSRGFEAIRFLPDFRPTELLIVFDASSVEEGGDWIMSELHVASERHGLSLVAAQRYEPHEWHLLDDGVAVCESSSLNELVWIPGREALDI